MSKRNLGSLQAYVVSQSDIKKEPLNFEENKPEVYFDFIPDVIFADSPNFTGYLSNKEYLDIKGNSHDVYDTLKFIHDTVLPTLEPFGFAQKTSKKDFTAIPLPDLISLISGEVSKSNYVVQKYYQFIFDEHAKKCKVPQVTGESIKKIVENLFETIGTDISTFLIHLPDYELKEVLCRGHFSPGKFDHDPELISAEPHIKKALMSLNRKGLSRKDCYYLIKQASGCIDTLKRNKNNFEPYIDFVTTTFSKEVPSYDDNSR